MRIDCVINSEQFSDVRRRNTERQKEKRTVRVTIARRDKQMLKTLETEDKPVHFNGHKITRTECTGTRSNLILQATGLGNSASLQQTGILGGWGEWVENEKRTTPRQYLIQTTEFPSNNARQIARIENRERWTELFTDKRDTCKNKCPTKHQGHAA